MDLLRTRRVDPVGQSPRRAMYGSFTHGTVPPRSPYSSVLPSRPDPLRPPSSPTHSVADGSVPRLVAVVQVLPGSPTTDRASRSFSLTLIGRLTPVPPGDRVSPPEVTRHSSVPCRPHSPWCGGWMRTPSPSLCRLDLAPPLADRFIFGVAPIDYGPVLLRMPFGFHLAMDTLPSGEG